MRTLKRIATSVVATITFTALYGLSSPSAYADTITVSPPKFELFGNPGDTVSEKIKVTNDGTADATYQTSIVDFTASGDEGGIDIKDDKNAPKTNFSLQKWVTLEPSRLNVPAGQSKNISAIIKIPKNAEPGGHYATVQVKLANAGEVGGGASVQSNLNTLFLLRVSGDIQEQLKLESFEANQNYYQKAPVTLNLKTTNSGNVHVAPSGTIVVTDMFNRKVDEIPLAQANVLPGGARSVHTVWNGNTIGRLTATLVADYGQSNKQRITATTTFIVFPLYLLWVIIGTLVVLSLLITKRKSFKKLLNRLTSD